MKRGCMRFSERFDLVWGPLLGMCRLPRKDCNGVECRPAAPDPLSAIHELNFYS